MRERTLEARIRVLGENHRDTRRSYAGLATALRESGQHERADALERQSGAPARPEPDGDAPR
ncbi:tetratricopeptide repeat protein [Streptomyces sp. NPDC055239]